jgi:hypothetical protein
MPQRNYIDFKLYLTMPAEGKSACQVALLPTPEVGETLAPVTVPIEKGPPADLLPFLASKSITLRKLVEYGKGLANCLLPAEKNDDQTSIRELFKDAARRAGNLGGVRLRLIIADPALKRLPWEYAYFDPTGVGGPDSMSGFLALNPCFSIMRHEPLPHPHPVTKDAGTDLTNLRMVVAVASPKTQRELDVDKEIASITQAVKDFDVDGVRFSLVSLLNATPPEVAQTLQGAGSTDIFHFAGHGVTETTRRDPFSIGKMREEGFLYFIDDKITRTEAKVRADDLAALLQAAGVHLAIFGACTSGMRSERYPWDGVAGALVKRDIPAIIAMQYEVIDTHAIAFTRSFYGALAAGLSLDEAMSAGRLAMYGVTSEQLDQPGFLEWGVPVLYSRLADGKIFPERMERAGNIAELLRATVQQTVDTITSTGRVVGIEARMVNGNFEVNQKAGIVEGEMIGVNAETVEGSGKVQQDVTTVTGNVTGIKLDEL